VGEPCDVDTNGLEEHENTAQEVAMGFILHQAALLSSCQRHDRWRMTGNLCLCRVEGKFFVGHGLVTPNNSRRLEASSSKNVNGYVTLAGGARRTRVSGTRAGHGDLDGPALCSPDARQ